MRSYRFWLGSAETGPCWLHKMGPRRLDHPKCEYVEAQRREGLNADLNGIGLADVLPELCSILDLPKKLGLDPYSVFCIPWSRHAHEAT